MFVLIFFLFSHLISESFPGSFFKQFPDIKSRQPIQYASQSAAQLRATQLVMQRITSSKVHVYQLETKHI